MKGEADAAGSERRLRVGVLGCGPIAQAAHFEACRRARNAELWAICDLADDLRERMALVHRPRVAYAAYDQMLADPDVEAVIVATADQFHVAHARQALAAGKHVLVEKPLGVAVEECELLRDEVARSGLTLQVGTMKRFDPGIAFARDFITDRMGEVLSLKAWYCDSTTRYTETGNLQPIIETSAHARRPPGDPKADRERYLLLGHGSHLADTARFLGGEIVAVRARLAEKFGARCWFVEAEFASGALGHLELAVPLRLPWHEGFEVHGEHGSVFGRTPNPWTLLTSQVECHDARAGVVHRPHGADGHAYRRQVEGFAATILDGVPQQGASAEDGLAAVRALVAIARSVGSGDWVRLADARGPV